MEYPQSFLRGCNQSCKSEYLYDNFVCGKLQEEVYCICCTLLLTEEKRKDPKSFDIQDSIILWKKNAITMQLHAIWMQYK